MTLALAATVYRFVVLLIPATSGVKIVTKTETGDYARGGPSAYHIAV